jgi:hypothetical protein
MGGAASKVDPLDQAEELARRVGLASEDRNKLTLISLNTHKLHAHATTVHLLAAKFTKAADQQVRQKAAYTTSLHVNQAALAAKQKAIEDLKHAKRLVVECRAALVPLQTQLDELVVAYEEGLGEMQAQKDGQRKGAKPKAAGQSATSPAALDEKATPPLDARKDAIESTQVNRFFDRENGAADDSFAASSARVRLSESHKGDSGADADAGPISVDADTLSASSSVGSATTMNGAARTIVGSKEAADLEEEDFEGDLS